MSPQVERAFSALEQLSRDEHEQMLIGFIIADHPEIVTAAVERIVAGRARRAVWQARAAAKAQGEAL
jgi:hypothetical protein